MRFLGVVGFKSSTLTAYCTSSWFIRQKMKTESTVCVPYGLSHLSWFQGLKYVSPSFWPSWKSDRLCYLSFTQLLFGVVGFKSSTLTAYCTSSWFICQKMKTESTLCVPGGLINLSWFQGLKYISPSFWPSWKSDLLCYLWFTKLFHDVKFFEENLKYLWRSYNNFCVYNM